MEYFITNESWQGFAIYKIDNGKKFYLSKLGRDINKSVWNSDHTYAKYFKSKKRAEEIISGFNCSITERSYDDEILIDGITDNIEFYVYSYDENGKLSKVQTDDLYYNMQRLLAFNGSHYFYNLGVEVLNACGYKKHLTKLKESKNNSRMMNESYTSEVDLMFDYEKIFKKKGWNVERESKNNKLSAMNVSIYKNTNDGQICFYIDCEFGVDGYGDYYCCQIDDCSDAEYDYNAVRYKGFEVSGRGFCLFERNPNKFCDYLEQTLKELANLK